MEQRVTAGNWFSIGLFTGPSPLDLAPASGIENPVLTYRDVTDVPAIFVADPFLVRRDGLWHLFFEVLNDRRYQGEIGLAIGDDAGRWDYRGRVLVEPFHVSYPHVFRWRGAYYMTPEMGDQNRVCLYRAASFPHDWRPVADLIEDGPVADPSPFRFDGQWWMFTCPRPADHDALKLYRADSLEGPWREHPKSPIASGDPHGARPAGRVVEWQGRLFRFAQVCAPRYGSAVRAFEITRLTAGDYREVAVRRPPIRPPAGQAWNSSAMHHVDAQRLADGSWIAVVDGHDHPSYRG